MKEKIMVVTFLIIIFSALIAFICIPDVELSYFERRNLTQFPTDFDEDFTEELDDYILDQFPLRNSLIKLNSLNTFSIISAASSSSSFL